MPEPTLRAAIYCRISVAALNDTTKTDDQERQCRELCQRRRWQVAEVYTDHSKSAWKRNRKRPAWDRMLADVAAGKAAAIVSYWGDRIVRQPRDLEDLLDLRDGRHIAVASIAGQYDFDNKDHRMMMRWEVARACNESDTISDRKKNEIALLRREGRVRPGGPGGRFYGFTSDGLTHVPAETAIIREMARRVLAGEGTRLIAASLNSRGETTVTGKAWTHAGIRRVVTNPRYAGLMPDGEQKAAWEPVLEREDWELARTMLAGRAAGYANATGQRRHLLSGIAVCGSCGKPAGPRQTRRAGMVRLGYGCVNPACKRQLHRSVAHLDAYIVGRMLEWLSSDQLAALVRKAPEPAAASEITVLEKRKAAAAKSLEALADHPGLDPAVTVRAIASFDERIAAVRERIAATPGRRLLAQYEGITLEEWEALPLATRRALVAASFRITILPARRGPGFDRDSVKVEPRE
jgi:DNA invertase Pin-like site-specific DNA recombinase